MDRSAFEPRCPKCKKKLTQVIADENVDKERGPFTCPHCRAKFTPKDAFSHTAKAIEKELQKRLDKIIRR